jgi:hypothetical protein
MGCGLRLSVRYKLCYMCLAYSKLSAVDFLIAYEHIYTGWRDGPLVTRLIKDGESGEFQQDCLVDGVWSEAA